MEPSPDRAGGSHAARLARYSAVSTSLALLSDRRLGELVDGVPPVGTGIGGTAVLLEVDGAPVFASAQSVQRLPRRACSRSIASNRALKLPLPKPIEPCRSISSKKTVGRSCTGLVKIWSR